jgi:hypothetical protein
MKRILVLVEGQTEEWFVKEMLEPHLLSLGLTLTAVIVNTRRLETGEKSKGGLIRYEQVKRELRTLLQDRNAVRVTTLFDFYGLPHDFPGMAGIPRGSCYERVAHVERAFASDINHPRFLPYLALHEFEAFIFTAPSRCAWVFSDAPQVIPALEQHRASVNSPEEINEGRETAPSKRIIRAYPRYQKTVHGPLAVLEIGLPALRAACPHFNQWLSTIEALG